MILRMAQALHARLVFPGRALPFFVSLILAAIICPAFPAAAQQDTANSNGSFWVHEQERVQQRSRPQMSAHQAPRIRRLMPHREFARPTIWHERPATAARPREAPAAVYHPGNSAPAGSAPSAKPSSTPEPDAEAPAQANVPAGAPANEPPASEPPASEPASGRDMPVAGVPAPDSAAASGPSPDAPPASAGAAKASEGPAFTVAVVGDNLAQMLTQGLQEAFPADEGIAILGKAKGSSGLVMQDFYDWPKSLREALSNGPHIDALVVMIGSNDRQSLRDSSGAQDALSPRWNELYGQRIDALLAIAKEKKVPVVWVGNPVMKGETYSLDISAINDLDRARVDAAGAQFVDVYDAFSDEHGAYSAFGPDLNGQIVKLRTGDGVHFTKPGARKLAHFVESDIRRLRDAARPSAAPAVAVIPPVAPLAGAPAAPPAIAPPSSASPATAAAPSAPAAPPKPIAGPVIILTAAPAAPGGDLLGGRNSAAMKTQVDPAVAEGKLASPPPGRIDDFAWPRP